MHVLFWICRSRINKVSYAPIMMRISFNNKRTSFSTSISVLIEKWDAQKQRIKGDNQLAVQQNNLLLALHSQVLYYYNDFVRKNLQPITTGRYPHRS
jgi:Arm DNA-binding domain